MMTTIEVLPRYIRTALTWARERNESFKQRESYQNRLEQNDRHPEIDNLIGVIGELGFATYADLKIDGNIYETGDDGFDFQVQIDEEQLTVDMKTRTGDLYTFWVKESALNADYYVLGKLHAPIDLDDSDLEDIDTLDGWEVDLLGTATKEDFLDARRIDSDLGHVNRSILLEDLRPVPGADKIVQVE